MMKSGYKPSKLLSENNQQSHIKVIEKAQIPVLHNSNKVCATWKELMFECRKRVVICPLWDSSKPVSDEKMIGGQGLRNKRGLKEHVADTNSTRLKCVVIILWRRVISRRLGSISYGYSMWKIKRRITGWPRKIYPSKNSNRNNTRTRMK